MTGRSGFDVPKRSNWVGAMVPVTLVLGVALLCWWLNEGRDLGVARDNLSSSTVASSEKLVADKTYYLFVSEIELYATDPRGKTWDDGPDIRYRMLWQGNEVHESNTKEDSLIADWSGLSLELEWLDLLGKKISPDSAIEAARVRAEQGGSVTIEVEDVDVISHDEAGRREIFFDDLRVGKKISFTPRRQTVRCGGS